MYYGNSAITTDGLQNQTGVWNDGGTNHFKGVLHLKEDPTGSGAPMKDSTAYANHGTTGGDMVSGQSAAGQIGQALSFDGNNDYVDFGSAASLNLAAQMTLAGWVKLSGANPGGVLAYKWNNSVFSGYLATAAATSAGFRLGFGDGTDASASAGATLQPDTWHQVSYTFDGNSMKIYIDGNLAHTQAIGSHTLGADSSQHLYFSTPDSGSQFSGSLDEMRASAIARSADWIKSEYNNEKNPAGFVTPMQEEVYGAAPAVSNPTFSPSAGTYPYTTQVTIASLTSGATIRYTIDGSDPATSVTAVVQVSPVTVSVVDNTRISAMATQAGYADSGTTSGDYFIRSSAYHDEATNTIILDGQNSLHRIYADIGDDNVISYNASGNSYTLKANVKILNSGNLTIQGTSTDKEQLVFNGPYLIWNHGELMIDNAVLTSSDKTNQDQRGRILNRLWDGDTQGWKFTLTHSDISYLGPGGVDEYGETRIGLRGYAPEGSDLNAKEEVTISDNHFSHIYEMTFGYITPQVNVINNDFTDFTIADNTAITMEKGLVAGNRFYDNSLYIIVYSYGRAVIRNNRFWNNIVAASGSFIKHKEGSGGLIVENNIIADDPNHPGTGWNSMPDGGFAILDGSSNRTVWTSIRGNTIDNVKGPGVYGIYVVGNGYSNPYPEIPPGYDVLMILENNTITNVSAGIYLSAHANFPNPPDGPINHAPRHMRLRNNRVGNTDYGILIDGEPYIDVVSVNDSFVSNTRASLAYGIMGDVCTNQTPLFINTQYTSITQPSGTLLSYQYLDVKVRDQTGNPVSGAVVTVTNEVDNIRYPAINLQGTLASSVATRADGYTPLPSDGYALPPDNTSNSLAVLDFAQTVAATTQMTYTITAVKRGRTASISGVKPGASWYRPAPDTHANTILLTLNMAGVPSAGDLACSYYPNPADFSKIEKMTVFYNLQEESVVDLRIYTVAGERVKTLVDNETESAGEHYAEWYGDTAGGNKAASGVYLSVIKIGKEIIKNKISILR